MTWTTDMALTPVGEHRYTAVVGEHWSSLSGAHGGVVAALAVRAAEHSFQSASAPVGSTFRSGTFGYANGNVPGELELSVDIVRQGKRMATAQVEVTQNGKRTTLARLHFATPNEGAAFSDIPDAPVQAADTWKASTLAPKHFANVDTDIDASTTGFSGAPRGEWRAWSRPIDANEIDSAWLTMFGDYFPPAVFVRSTERSMPVTIEYTIQIHKGEGVWAVKADERLAAQMHVSHSHDGFAVEDGWIWLPTGQLLATVRQTRLAG